MSPQRSTESTTAESQQAWLCADELGIGRRSLALGFLLVAYFFYAWSWNTIDILRPYMESPDLGPA